MNFLAQRRRDGGGWLQMLVFIVIAAIYIIGGVLKKARDNQIDLEDEEEPVIPRKPGARPGVQRPGGRVQAQRPDLRIMAQRPSTRRIEPETTKPVFDIERPLIQQPSMQAERQLEKALKSVTQSLKEEPLAGPLQRAEGIEAVIEPMVGFDEPDAIKKAIIYHEILGKPLSLRGPLQ